VTAELPDDVILPSESEDDNPNADNFSGKYLGKGLLDEEFSEANKVPNTGVKPRILRTPDSVKDAEKLESPPKSAMSKHQKNDS
jgi:hypothetical protein